MSLEDVAIKVCIEFGKRASLDEIYGVLADNGMRNPTNDVVDRVIEMVNSAVIRVKVRLV